MKIFWLIVAVLVAAFGIMLVTNGSDDGLTVSTAGQRSVSGEVAAEELAKSTAPAVAMTPEAMTEATTEAMPGAALSNVDTSSATESASRADKPDESVIMKAAEIEAAMVASAEASVESVTEAFDESDVEIADAVTLMIADAADAVETVVEDPIETASETAGDITVVNMVGVEDRSDAALGSNATSLDSLLDIENVPSEAAATSVAQAELRDDQVASEVVNQVASDDADRDDADNPGVQERVTQQITQDGASLPVETDAADANDAAEVAIANPTQPTQTDPALSAAESNADTEQVDSDQTVPAEETVADVRTTTLGSEHTVVGKGTAEDPMIIPWTVFRSAAFTYRPERGMTELPTWSQDLHGKHVVVTGYTMAPVVAAQTSELMIMQNQWDGCCLGIPPTPYDAIEVRMSTPIPMARMASLAYGSLQGVIKVDPYLHNQWLLGLYVLEDASIVTTQ